MPYQIVRGDITNLPKYVDAIVNTARYHPEHGLGTDAAIYKKAGPRLQESREYIGHIREGSACVTPAFDLNAKIIIHTVAPVWRGGKYGEEDILKKCYLSSLQQAIQYGCHSIAFPLIGSGNLGFPHPIALKLAVNAFIDFCFQHDIEIYLVLFDQTSFEYGEKIYGKIPEWIDNHQAVQTSQAEYCWDDGIYVPAEQTHRLIRASRSQRTARKDGIDDVFRDNPTASFSEIVEKLRLSLNKKKADIYNHGNISAQAFKKVLDGANPKKPMAVTISVALMLDLEQTKNLIARAGHTLNPDNSWDNIVIDAIEAHIFNVPQINRMLAEKEHTIFLGSK